MVERMYEHGKALNMASHFEIDDVIDPADTRRWITTMLDSAPAAPAACGQEAPQHRHLVSRPARDQVDESPDVPDAVSLGHPAQGSTAAGAAGVSNW